MKNELKSTLRFVVLIATPLCLVNGLIFSLGSQDLIQVWFSRFGFTFLVTFPQAVLYVSVVKWFDKRNKV
ncbi:hypothetical protein SAMN05192540_3986 [Maribacter dokdonensis]|uniref:Uncharacterized protein n=1 Tax=Maribacter dokdonensis TaxID=320912 RepID=A0A1H4V1Y4_9FLAO|nr:hypothetical protein SAMN05192540_3986 [Maribacter dokdonensis]